MRAGVGWGAEPGCMCAALASEWRPPWQRLATDAAALQAVQGHLPGGMAEEYLGQIFLDLDQRRALAGQRKRLQPARRGMGKKEACSAWGLLFCSFPVANRKLARQLARLSGLKAAGPPLWIEGCWPASGLKAAGPPLWITGCRPACLD
jgi:hypothetical protein